MIRITIETTLSTHYALFRLRWLIIAIQLICLIMSIILAAAFSNWISRPLWAATASVTAASIAVCVWDLVAHQKGMTPPNSPRSSSPITKPLPVSAEAGEASTSQPAGATPRPSTDADVISITAEDERIPFLPPRPLSISEKSDEGNGKLENLPFQPNKLVTAMDFFLTVSFVALFIANMVVESVAWNGYYGYGPSGYVLRTHATLGTVFAVILHLHCFYKEVKALKKEKSKDGYRRVGKGVIRI